VLGNFKTLHPKIENPMSYRGPDPRILKLALNAYIENMKKEEKEATLSDTRLRCRWEVKRAKDALYRMEQKTPFSGLMLAVMGGSWLGAAREWIKSNFVNGETVTWGSQEFLRGKNLTVSDVEHFAARIAVAAIDDYRGKQ
jgi:hypothetical protein